MTLAGQVALVTGSSSGIGAAVARGLAAEVPEGHYVQGDIADPAAATALVDGAARRWGRLDLLVNNAGTTARIDHADLSAVTPEVWDRVLGVNVVGTWNVTRAAVPHLRAAGAGCVVNVGSLAGVRPVGSSIPYAVSKAALHHMTRLLAATLGPAIRVNAIAPGLIDTPWTQDWDDVRGLVRALAPLQRSGTPQDCVEAVLYLARGTYTTGEVLVVDGGLQLR